MVKIILHEITGGLQAGRMATLAHGFLQMVTQNIPDFFIGIGVVSGSVAPLHSQFLAQALALSRREIYIGGINE